MKREYLKHKLQDLEELPYKLSMRNSAKWGNCNWRPNSRRWYDSSRLLNLYRHIDKFLQNSVGKKYDDVYSEYTKKFPKYYCGRDLREYFRDRFIEHQNRTGNWRYNCYYVEDGIIKDGYIKNNKSKDVKIKVNRQTPTYKFNQEALKDKRVVDIVDYYLPHKYRHYLHSDLEFSLKVFNSMFDHLTVNNNLNKELINLHSKSWWRENYNQFGIGKEHLWLNGKYVDGDYILYNSTLKKFLFTEINNDIYDLVSIDSKEFKRNLSDNRKKRKAALRLTSKEYNEYLENLLHDLLQARKKKEKEENDLIRDRHGFDDHSFKNW